jgi:leucyl aminopeptidase
MDFNIKTGQPEKLRTDCLVLAVFEKAKLPETTENIDKLSKGVISKILKQGDLEGKLGQTLVLRNVANIAADRILLVGCGKPNEFTDKNFREVMLKMAAVLHSMQVREATCCITELAIKDYDVSWAIQQAVVLSQNVAYKFLDFKSKEQKAKIKPSTLKKLTWLIAHRRDSEKAEYGIEVGKALYAGIKLTKDLANTPPNICTPEYLGQVAQKMGKTYKNLSVAVLNRKQIESLKMGALVSVGQGSVHPPKLITLEYRGAAKTQQPIVLVGKGITFDTGGNSLKPAANMVGMKYDMCGAAAVLGAITFAAELGLNINLVGVIAAAENMPGGSASRPDDIITTMAGITVEILNTDAEGRLVLSDALTYSERFNPKAVIDMATLTSAAVVALGNHHSALFSNHQPLADELLAAGIVSGDRCWQLPLTEEYLRQLDSNVADMANVGGGTEGGCIVAASFLSRFTKKYHWAHLDIAGTACRFTGKDRNATGQPVSLIAEYLLSKAN